MEVPSQHQSKFLEHLEKLTATTKISVEFCSWPGETDEHTKSWVGSLTPYLWVSCLVKPKSWVVVFNPDLQRSQNQWPAKSAPNPGKSAPDLSWLLLIWMTNHKTHSYSMSKCSWGILLIWEAIHKTHVTHMSKCSWGFFLLIWVAHHKTHSYSYE